MGSEPIGPLAENIPALAAHPSHLIHLALAVLGDGDTTVIDADAPDGDCVWLPGPGQLVRVQAVVDREAGTAILPRPLAGQTLTSPPAGLLPADRVGETCQELKELLDDLIAFHAALRSMAQVGHDAADNVAAEWAQDTIGGRASGDVRATAHRVLAGIDDGDPAVLDALPEIPIDTADATRRNETLVEIYEETIRFAHVYPHAWDELGAAQRVRLLDALVAGFHCRFHDAVAAECRAVVDPS
ncbi:hypothetical protein R8Z50_22800 [Longispora sp. K20-0274]|uniref:hypothetical protein n=1 Tax=Longispora sp. K20-0274 TaxID=3088255 RepID=UPI00399BBE01